MSANFFSINDAGAGAGRFNEIASLFKRLLARIRTLDLVTVVSCTNSGTVSAVGLVSVRVLTNQRAGSGQGQAHGTIYQVPYLRLQGGNTAVILDPQAGDVGMCGFCSRDISAVKAALIRIQGGASNVNQQQDVGSNRMFDWADGLYFGGFLNATPTRYVQFDGAGNVNVRTPSGVVNLNGTTIDASGNVVVKSGSTVTDGAGIVLETHQHNPGTYVAGSTAVTGKSDVPTT